MMIESLISEDVESIIRQAAEEIICPHFQNLSSESIRTKTNDNDLVTIADEESEAFLAKNLSKLLPQSMVLGEESYFKNPGDQACLASDKPVWIIDPVDGTANFAKGSPVFGVIVSLVIHCETIAGWIFDPIQDRMFSAKRGEGVIRNGKQVLVKKPGERQTTELIGCIGQKRRTPYKDKFAELIRSGCSAHDYMAICEGSLDFRFFKSLNPWDHAAGTLMVSELGGCARLMSENNYTPVFHKKDTLLVTRKSDEWGPIHRILM